MFRKQLAENKPADDDPPPRPDLAGYDQVADGLLGIRRELAVLIRVTANKPTYPLPQGPVFPAERFAVQDDHAEADRLEASVAAGLQRGRELDIG
ncbi:hypothetical protein [Mycolicibacterium mucogenicum]|uniref:Uncharacterized protein n=1 Tax=Mycolicibacterium mucogenicum DSM 44124 TaxID=1226753 RepID=A0A8H2PK22_MYCMU|nr:hypothetical protein [Mycolicibacterium mucogenicum]KAB7752878.1 hypothetical protein MMUC44124_26450 [Mycolicibacterium mucogenicum DSM 44124]QPG69084.1 hypothetical protein C1S78_027475 [Mycolicibacterium mucogenicum DSM 44124]